MATRHLLADLAAAAVEAGLPGIEIESTGGVDAARRVAAGEPFDLVFLALDALDALAAAGHVDATSVIDLVVSQVAVAVRGTPDDVAEPPSGAAFADAEGMRAALVAAERIGYSTGPSGNDLVAMIERWGLQDAVGPKLVQARPGVPVAALLGAGEVDLGFQQLSELVGQPAVRITGVLPHDCAIDTVFAGAVACGSDEAPAASSVLGFFRSPAAAAIAVGHHFRPCP